MNESTTMYVGLDLRKDSIDIALADAARDSEVRHLGSVAGRVIAVTKAMRRLVSAGHRAAHRLRGGSVRVRAAAPLCCAGLAL